MKFKNSRIDFSLNDEKIKIREAELLKINKLGLLRMRKLEKADMKRMDKLKQHKDEEELKLLHRMIGKRIAQINKDK